MSASGLLDCSDRGMRTIFVKMHNFMLLDNFLNKKSISLNTTHPQS